MDNSKHKYINIGKLVATHGLKGELVLKHSLGKKTALKNLETVFVKDKTAGLLPWFIEIAKTKNETEIYLKLEGVDTVEEARQLVQKEVWFTQKDFEKHASKTSVVSLLGFTVINGEESLGVIEEIIEQPHQILCRIMVKDNEVFIPLHEETLKKIDHKKRTVTVALPDGLLDIYLT